MIRSWMGNLNRKQKNINDMKYVGDEKEERNNGNDARNARAIDRDEERKEKGEREIINGMDEREIKMVALNIEITMNET